jgi:hypothetical protein
MQLYPEKFKAMGRIKKREKVSREGESRGMDIGHCMTNRKGYVGDATVLSLNKYSRWRKNRSRRL